MPSLPPELFVVGGTAFAATAAFGPVVRPPPPKLRGAVAVAASVVVALATDAAPTGHEAVDVVYRALFAGLVAVAVAHAAPAVVATAAVGAVLVAWPDAAAGSVAAAALGIAVAAWLTRRSTGQVVGPLVAFALLRGTWPDAHGATATVAAATVAVLVLGSVRRWPPAGRRWARRGALAAGAFLLVATGSAAVVAWQSAEAVRRATAASTRVVRTARQGDSPVLRGALREAGASFAEAERWTGSPLAWPGRAVPVVSQHLDGLSRGAQAGARLARRLDRTTARSDLAGLQVVDGGVDVAALRRTGAALAEAREALHDADAALAEADSPWLLAPVRSTLHRQAARVSQAADEADTAARVVELLPAFLGADEPRRYFLAVQTPVESRAAGGLIGSFGELVAEGGRARVERFGRLRELNRGGARDARTVAGPPDFLARYGRFQPATTWQNVNMSPDFPTVAEVIGGLYPQSGGAPVDGVVTVDPTALAALLRLTGPVRVPSWPERLTPENVEHALYFEQYRRFAYDERVDFLGEVALRVTQRLTSMRIPNVRRLVDVLAPVVRGRHLAVAATRVPEQALLDDLGLSARMPPVAVDSLALVTQNASGNKIDWFLRRSVAYRAVVDEATGTIEAEVEIRLRNEAPAAGLPPAIIGSVTAPPLPPGTNRLFLSVYTPWRLADSTVPLEAGVELGRRVYGTFLDVPPGGEVRLQLSLRGVLPRATPYRLDVVRQPVVAPDRVEVDVTTTDGSVLAQAAGPLPADRTFVARGGSSSRR